MLPTTDAAYCPTPPPRRRRRRSPIIAAVAAGALAITGLTVAPAYASHPEVSLTGSNFEIEHPTTVQPDGTIGANLRLNDAAPSEDWASIPNDLDTSNTDNDNPEKRKTDTPSGSGDNAFGNGSKEDTEPPSVVAGSIPPNKSDLKTFGTYLEKTAGGDFLHLFWHRVQDPTGTTNMDFEFNQDSVISSNGVTPKRTAGDLLIQYDLANGGTNPQLFLSRWLTTGPGNACEASNSTPCWSDRTNLSAAGDATGSINTSAIAAANADGLGNISPRTFGEASVDFSAIVGGGCVSFGSAYLKSRSSDSFSAALKDFIAPLATNIDTCASVTIRKVTDPSPDPTDSSFDFTTANFVTPDETDPTFSLKNGEDKSYAQVFIGDDLSVTEDLSALPTGWKLADIDCSESKGVVPEVDESTGTITFDLDSNGDSVDCTYYNETGGTVIVRKVTDPTTDPEDWPFGFTKAFDTLEASDPTFTLGNGEHLTFENVLFGEDLTITEDDLPDGWDLDSINCEASSEFVEYVADPDTGTVTFDIEDADDTLDCTYGNVTGGQVIIRKVTQPSPDASDTSFSYSTVFSTLSGATNPAFTLKDGENQPYTDVLFGTGLTVTEDSPLPDGWELVSLDCSKSSADVVTSVVGATVTFAIDETTDVLDCTYTNRARGTIIVEKITDDGEGSFDFTSTTLTPSPFTLTTTDPGEAGKDSRTFADLDPGTYDVTEEVPDNWNLDDATCDDSSDPASIGLSAGETVTCTFTNVREVGAIEITKLRKHAVDGLGVDHPFAGVAFVITGGELPVEGVTVTTDENGVACATDLLVTAHAGLYTITETVPAGYAPVGTQTANVTEAADCDSANEGAVKVFNNIPLTNIEVSFHSQVEGGTFSSIECYVTADGPDAVPDVSLDEELGDATVNLDDLEPGNYRCDFVVDP